MSLSFAAVTVSVEPEPAAASAVVAQEVSGAELRIATDAPSTQVAAVVRSLRR